MCTFVEIWSANLHLLLETPERIRELPLVFKCSTLFLVHENAKCSLPPRRDRSLFTGITKSRQQAPISENVSVTSAEFKENWMGSAAPPTMRQKKHVIYLFNLHFLFLFIMTGEAELYLPSLMARHTMIHSHNHTRRWFSLSAQADVHVCGLKE